MGIKSRHPLKMGTNQNDLKSANHYKIGFFKYPGFRQINIYNW